MHFGNPIRIHIEGLRIANAPWSDVKDMADIQAIDLELRPWPLLHGDIQIPELKVAGPKVILEKNPDGAANWDFGDVPVYPGVSDQTSAPPYKTPAQARATMKNWRMQCGITGGWLWIFDQIAGTRQVQQYAKAITKGVGGGEP